MRNNVYELYNIGTSIKPERLGLFLLKIAAPSSILCLEYFCHNGILFFFYMKYSPCARAFKNTYKYFSIEKIPLLPILKSHDNYIINHYKQLIFKFIFILLYFLTTNLLTNTPFYILYNPKPFTK